MPRVTEPSPNSRPRLGYIYLVDPNNHYVFHRIPVLDDIIHKSFIVDIPGHPGHIGCPCDCRVKMRGVTGQTLPDDIEDYLRETLGWIILDDTKVVIVDHRAPIERLIIPDQTVALHVNP